MFSSRRILAAALLIGLLVAFPAGAAAAPAITLRVIIGQSCIDGSGPADTPHIATLRTPSGAFRASFRVRSDDTGAWAGCFPFITPTVINGGDRLRIVAGSTVRHLTVPRLEPRINRVGDVISGRAAPGVDVDILVSHRSNFKASSEHPFADQADVNGRYRVDTTAELDLLGGDQVFVVVQQGSDLFGALANVPFMQVSHANNFVLGTVNNGTDLALELYNPNGIRKAVATAGPIVFGFFEVAMFRADGRAAYPLAGDRLIASFSSDARLRLPASSLRGTAVGDVISGRCMADAPYELLAGFERFAGKTGADGRFQRDISNRMNLRKGDELSLTCLYPTGDLWTRTGVAS
jgi:hypothetical protein